MMRASMLRAALRVLVVAGALGASRGAAPAACVGDCGGDGQVAINELIRGVTIALGTEPPSACPAFQNAQGQVTIAQLIQGVNNALNGCPSGDGGLAGEPGARALDAVADVFSAQAYVTPAELIGALVRTQVELAFRKDATVGAVNDLLGRIEGRIVSSRRGVLILVVRIPDPGSAAALDLLLAELAAEPIVRLANRVTMPESKVLPAIILPGTERVQFVRQHLAVRAHAAWNARAALDTATPPTLVVGDFFGDGPPGDLFGVVAEPADFGTDLPNDHGYLVLGIAAAAFDEVGGSLAADAVTGMFPGTISLRAADVAGGLGGAALDDLMLTLVENAPGNVVLSTSLGSSCKTIEDAALLCTREAATALALGWIERVRGTNWPDDLTYDLEGRFLHATAASNVESIGRLGADVSSRWNAATLISPLVDPVSLAVVPNLTNTLVVENFTSTADEPFRPGCIAPSSELGGTIAAIGSPVYSFISPTTAAPDEDGGTSSATPQVAGLAAYVWAIRPGLTPAELVALLQRTAQAVPGCGNGLIIDAYAALLAADEGNSTRPVRGAILDVADSTGNEGRNGAFDERDLDLFLARLDTPATGQIDYGRYDLNGDGITGVPSAPSGSKRVDLDLDGTYGLATLDVEGLPLRFDEEVSSDLKILCHAAYSDLYTGNPAGDHQARRERLGLARCLDLGFEVLFPATVVPGVNNLLSVRMVDRDVADLSGSAVGQPGVRIELTVTGGTADSFIGTTNADGIFQTNARLFAGQPELTIEVVARVGESGPELARTTVTAPISDEEVTISVEPLAATLPPGGTQPFNATVLGANNVDVTWTATGGTITPTGLYTAGSTAGVFSVTATSVEDPTQSASAVVTIASPGPAFGGTTGGLAVQAANPGISKGCNMFASACNIPTFSQTETIPADTSGAFGSCPVERTQSARAQQSYRWTFSADGTTVASIAMTAETSAEVSPAASTPDGAINCGGGGSSALAVFRFTFGVGNQSVGYHLTGRLVTAEMAFAEADYLLSSPQLGTIVFDAAPQFPGGEKLVDVQGTLTPGEYTLQVRISVGAGRRTDAGRMSTGSYDLTLSFD